MAARKRTGDEVGRPLLDLLNPETAQETTRDLLRDEAVASLRAVQDAAWAQYRASGDGALLETIRRCEADISALYDLGPGGA